MSVSTGKTDHVTTATVNMNAQMVAVKWHANANATKSAQSVMKSTNRTVKQKKTTKNSHHGFVAELADALDLGSSSTE